MEFQWFQRCRLGSCSRYIAQRPCDAPAPLDEDANIPTSYVNATTETTPIAKDVAQATAMTSIPAVTAAGTPVYVYIYFEGEDANLKTDNVTETLDDLTVTFKFALDDHAVNATDNGVAL